MPLLLILFIALPLIEITLFIQIGGIIGLWPTLAIVIGTAVAGSMLLRRQGARALADVQRAFVEFRDPTAPLAHGALMFLAGALLISPGFFTDTMGLLLLIPAVRTAVLSLIGRRMMSRVSHGFRSPPDAAPHRYGRGVVIDADYVDVEDVTPVPPQPGPRRPSGWTQH